MGGNHVNHPRRHCPFCFCVHRGLCVLGLLRVQIFDKQKICTKSYVQDEPTLLISPVIKQHMFTFFLYTWIVSIILFVKFIWDQFLVFNEVYTMKLQIYWELTFFLFTESLLHCCTNFLMCKLYIYEIFKIQFLWYKVVWQNGFVW